MRQPTGSKAHRAVACPASMVLPIVSTLVDPAPAIRGRDVHRYLQRCSEVGPDVALGEAPEALRPYLATIDLAALPTALAPEVAFAWDWRARRGRELGRGLDRAYGELGPTEVALTVDLYGAEPSRSRVYVGDYKTGRTRYPRPAKWGQTLLGGLAAASVAGADSAVLELIYIDEDGLAWPSRDEVDSWDLEAFAEALEEAMTTAAALDVELAAGRAVSVTTGDHCDYCQSYQYCPAKTALVRALPGAIDQLEAQRADGGLLAPDRIADTWHRIQAMREILGRLESEIYQVATREPIPLGDGREIGLYVTERESLDGDIAAGVIEAWYGSDAAHRATKRSVSKEALETAVREGIARAPLDSAGKRRRITSKVGDGELDRILEEIGRRDGRNVKRTSKVDVHRPRRRLGP